MAYIYEPAGKAKEYGELALNLYNGCSHGCSYCYVPAACHTTRQAMLNPKVRKIDEKKLLRELPALSGRSVFLCFTCDPYQELDETEKRTRKIIETLHAHDIGVRILTKGGDRSRRDFDLLSARPGLSSYGATLTFVSKADSTLWEPGAAPPISRLNVLKAAHSLGIHTWASLEPVINPGQSLALIEESAAYVDLFKVGKWNHDERAARIDWAAFAAQAVHLLIALGKSYYIKRDLAAYLPPDVRPTNI